MRYEQLPQKLRDQVDAQIGRAPRAKRSRKVATGEGTTTRWRCATEDCGEEFTSEAGFKDHPHPRIEVVIVLTGAR